MLPNIKGDSASKQSDPTVSKVGARLVQRNRPSLRRPCSPSAFCPTPLRRLRHRRRAAAVARRAPRRPSAQCGGRRRRRRCETQPGLLGCPVSFGGTCLLQVKYQPLESLGGPVPIFRSPCSDTCRTCPGDARVGQRLGGMGRAALNGSSLPLAFQNMFYFPLLVLKGIHHYGKYLLIFPGDLSKWRVYMQIRIKVNFGFIWRTLLRGTLYHR